MNAPALCPVCSCPIQRTDGGTLDDGFREHSRVVHPDQVVYCDGVDE